ncbi:uncharacterized protein LOC122251167 [Penaeus japonicus]|uniref:uncharacterized protein LOC122251167 n=1 Tax=Penaeus japonicus TaxID=27405 RepID=UPI001C70D484|nr:uncharacterized protein LOC122251167 [Penaeus japonicus]
MVFNNNTLFHRDKYLNGAPISSYSGEWQARTGSNTTWQFRWHHYWLPTLLSSGRVAPTPSFYRMVRRHDLAFRFITRNYRKEGAALVLPEARTSGFDAFSYHVGTHMVTNGRQVGLDQAVRMAYEHVDEDLMRLHGNASFSFEEFLRFVIWEQDLGVLDQHWTPYVDTCFPCLEDYEYILHLESVSEESKVLLRDVGYPEDVQLTSEHKIRGISEELSWSDAKYFENIPSSLLEKVVSLFEADFDLFGYKKSFS